MARISRRRAMGQGSDYGNIAASRPRFSGTVADPSRVFGLPRGTPIEFTAVDNRTTVFVPGIPGHKSMEDATDQVNPGITDIQEK